MGLFLSAFLLTGCGGAGRRPQDRAESAVDKVLDGWARGEPADKYAESGQPIQASDPDWSAGYRLLSFLSVDARQPVEGTAEVRCRVALSLQDRAGKKLEKEVVYRVQLGDSIIIARE
jgi:hypothetical protein